MADLLTKPIKSVRFEIAGADKSLARPRRKQASKLEFIQHIPHESQYSSQPVAINFASH